MTNVATYPRQNLQNGEAKYTTLRKLKSLTSKTMKKVSGGYIRSNPATIQA